MTLEGKKAIVTGGSLGIGAATARELGRQGASVAINYRKHDTEAKQVVADIEAMGRQGLAVQADVASFADAERMVAQVVAAFGGLDILVNNAGINRDAVSWKMTEQQWDEVIDVNHFDHVADTSEDPFFVIELVHGQLVLDRPNSIDPDTGKPDPESRNHRQRGVKGER